MEGKIDIRECNQMVPAAEMNFNCANVINERFESENSDRDNPPKVLNRCPKL